LAKLPEEIGVIEIEGCKMLFCCGWRGGFDLGLGDVEICGNHQLCDFARCVVPPAIVVDTKDQQGLIRLGMRYCIVQR